MSTTYHTPVAFNAPANAAIVNAPLGQLDAAIGAIGYPYLTNQTLLVDAAYSGNNTAAKRFITIAAAMAAATAGSTIVLAPATYVENVTFGADDIKLVGSGAAQYDRSGPTWGAGTIIQGHVNLNNKKRVLVSDLSVDASNALLEGVYGGATQGGNPIYQEVRNVVCVGSGYSALAHGILLESGSHNVVQNVKIYSFAHGIALRCSYTNLSNAYIENCSLSGIIVKSDTVSGDAQFVNITNVVLKSAMGIVIESDNAAYATRHVNVSNVSGFSTGPNLVSVRQSAGACEHISLNNCNSSNNTSSTVAAFEVQSGTDIVFTNCHANLAGYVSFRNIAGVRCQLVGCGSKNPSVTHATGAWANQQINGFYNGSAQRIGSNFSVANNAWTSVTGFAGLVDLVGVTTSTYITAWVTGTYRITGYAIFASNNTGVRGVRFYAIIAASAYAEMMVNSTVGQPTVVLNEYIISLGAGEEVLLQAYQNSGGALNALAGTTIELELIQAS